MTFRDSLPPTCRFYDHFRGPTAWVDYIRASVIVVAIIVVFLGGRVLWNWFGRRKFRPARTEWGVTPWSNAALMLLDLVVIQTEYEQLGTPATSRLWIFATAVLLQAIGATRVFGVTRRPFRLRTRRSSRRVRARRSRA